MGLSHQSGFSVLKQPGFSISIYFIAARLHFPALPAQGTAVALGNRHLQSTFSSRTHCSVPEARPAGGTATAVPAGHGCPRRAHTLHVLLRSPPRVCDGRQGERAPQKLLQP